MGRPWIGDGEPWGDEMPPAAILRMAQAAVGKWAPANVRHWYDDLVGHVILLVLEAREQGHRSSWRVFRWYVSMAIRYVVRNRGDETPTWIYGEEPTVRPHELHGLCMRRLQEVWPTLTDAQKAGLYSVIVDGYGALNDAASVFGVNPDVINNARVTALRRLDNPREFRVGAYGMKTKSAADAAADKVARYERRLAQTLESKKRRKAKGLCTDCAQPRDAESTSQWRCSPCTGKARLSKERWRNKQHEKRAAMG